MCSLYLGDQIISGQTTLVGESRNIGQVISSTIPLTDAGLHLLDGSLILGSGIYSAFVTAMAAIYETNPELFCTEQKWQQSIAQYGVCGKFVYDSVNNTVRLPKLYSNERYLIDSSSSGTQWYRVYSDGWCEQGGYTTKNGTYAISLLKTMKDTNYSIGLIESSNGTNNPGGSQNSIPIKGSCTENSIYVYINTSSGLGAYWEVRGYIDISGYQNTEKYEYIVLATSTKTDIQVDLDNVTTEINNMVSKNDLSEVQCVVETYSNGTSWYRVYSDGWCEQGGYKNSGQANSTVTFLKPFKDTNYSAFICPSQTGTSTYAISTGTKTTTTCVFFVNSYSTPYNWQASGYIEV